MFELFGWDIGMSAFAALLLVAGAVAIGIVAHLVGEVRTGWEGPIVALAAFLGGYLGSEALAGADTWGIAFEGMNVWPAIIGALVIGVVVDAITRYATDGSYVRHPHPI